MARPGSIPMSLISGDVLNLLTQVAALGLGLGLGALWPRDPRPVLNRDSWINLLTGAGLYVLKLLIGLTGVYAARVGLLSTNGLSNPVAQCLCAFLLIDFARYWLHRAHHRVPLLWHFHRVHHSLRSLDSTAGFRMHAVDFLQLSVLPGLVFGVLLDTSSWASWAIPAAMVPGVVADALEHSNLRWPSFLDPRLRYVFNNPLFHSWHHVRDADLCDGAYANALPAWDLLFGSDVSQAQPPAEYGLVPEKDLSNDVLGLQLLKPAGVGSENRGP